MHDKKQFSSVHIIVKSVHRSKCIKILNVPNVTIEDSHFIHDNARFNNIYGIFHASRFT
jgi:hypothetical protein